jgi:hypothetical protein
MYKKHLGTLIILLACLWTASSILNNVPGLYIGTHEVT